MPTTSCVLRKPAVKAASREVVVVVRADIADREELAVDMADGDGIIVNEDLSHRAGGDLIGPSYRNVTGHAS